MRVLAIDPGYERMGVAVLEKSAPKEKLLYSSCVITPKTKAFSARLLQLGENLEKLIGEYGPDYLILEKLFFTVNQKTAMAVSEVRGMLLYLAAKHGLEILEYTPLQVKSTVTGFGKADKNQVMKMVAQLVILPTKPKHDDEYDAIAVGLTALAQMKFAV